MVVLFLAVCVESRRFECPLARTRHCSSTSLAMRNVQVMSHAFCSCPTETSSLYVAGAYAGACITAPNTCGCQCMKSCLAVAAHDGVSTVAGMTGTQSVFPDAAVYQNKDLVRCHAVCACVCLCLCLCCVCCVCCVRLCCNVACVVQVVCGASFATPAGIMWGLHLPLFLGNSIVCTEFADSNAPDATTALRLSEVVTRSKAGVLVLSRPLPSLMDALPRTLRQVVIDTPLSRATEDAPHIHVPPPPGVSVCHVSGPYEMMCCSHVIHMTPSLGNQPVNTLARVVGVPMPSVQCRFVEPHNQRASVALHAGGRHGQLCIKSPVLARGVVTVSGMLKLPLDAYKFFHCHRDLAATSSGLFMLAPSPSTARDAAAAGTSWGADGDVGGVGGGGERRIVTPSNVRGRGAMRSRVAGLHDGGGRDRDRDRGRGRDRDRDRDRDPASDVGRGNDNNRDSRGRESGVGATAGVGGSRPASKSVPVRSVNLYAAPTGHVSRVSDGGEEAQLFASRA